VSNKKVGISRTRASGVLAKREVFPLQSVSSAYREGMRVMRSNLDGSQIETLVEAGHGDGDRSNPSNWCVGIMSAGCSSDMRRVHERSPEPPHFSAKVSARCSRSHSQVAPAELRLPARWRRVRKYLPKRPTGCPRGDQRWSTFLKNHAQAIVACDLFVCVTSTFQLLYVLVVMEHHSRRLIHCNVTAHPTAAWTRQQLREALGFEPACQYLIHDRDSIFSAEVDGSVGSFGLRVLKTPRRCPMANGICERIIGTIRRECLDWIIPLSEAHLRRVLRSWIAHYNRGRPHMALGPGVPDPPAAASRPKLKSRHSLDGFGSVHAKAVLGGLHHEYSLGPA
jgi:transposase InsO family protein